MEAKAMLKRLQAYSGPSPIVATASLPTASCGLYSAAYGYGGCESCNNLYMALKLLHTTDQTRELRRALVAVTE
jgi:hypothetical protein